MELERDGTVAVINARNGIELGIAVMSNRRIVDLHAHRRRVLRLLPLREERDVRAHFDSIARFEAFAATVSVRRPFRKRIVRAVIAIDGIECFLRRCHLVHRIRIHGIDDFALACLAVVGELLSISGIVRVERYRVRNHRHDELVGHHIAHLGGDNGRTA